MMGIGEHLERKKNGEIRNRRIFDIWHLVMVVVLDLRSSIELRAT